MLPTIADRARRARSPATRWAATARWSSRSTTPAASASSRAGSASSTASTASCASTGPRSARSACSAFVYGGAAGQRSPTRARTRRSPPRCAPRARDAHSAVYPGEHNLETVQAHLPAMLTFAGRALAQTGARRMARADRSAASRCAASRGTPPGVRRARSAPAPSGRSRSARWPAARSRSEPSRSAASRSVGWRSGRLALGRARGGEVVLDSLEVGALKVGHAHGRAHRRARGAPTGRTASNIVGAFGETITEVPMASVGSDLRNVELVDDASCGRTARRTSCSSGCAASARCTGPSGSPSSRTRPASGR